MAASIKNEDLIKLISKQSDLTKKEAEQGFNDLIEFVGTVKKGSPKTVEDFGTFRLKKGRLAFESDETFAIEINYKYAGMQPIQISKGKESLNSDSLETEELEEPIKKGKVTSIKKTDKTDSELLKEDIEVTENSEVTETKSEDKPSVEAPEFVSEKEENTKEVRPEIKETESNATEVQNEQDVSKDSSKPDAAETDTKKEPQNIDFKKESERQSKLVLGLVAAIIIVVLSIFGINHIVQQSDDEKPLSDEVIVDKEVVAPPVSIDKAIPKTNDEANQKQQEQVVADVVEELTNAPSIKEVKKEPISYGIKGSFNGEINSFYTLVIYTLSFEARAELEVEDFSKKGFRSSVNTINGKSKTLYQVIVGQFETIDDAKNAIPELPTPYNQPGKQFVKRIK